MLHISQRPANNLVLELVKTKDVISMDVVLIASLKILMGQCVRTFVLPAARSIVIEIQECVLTDVRMDYMVTFAIYLVITQNALDVIKTTEAYVLNAGLVCGV